MKVSIIVSKYVSKMSTFISWIDGTLERLIAEGADEFYLNNTGIGCILAAQAVLIQKEKHPQIRTILVLSSPKKAYIRSYYDEVICPIPNAPTKSYAHIHRRWMVEHSDIILAYTGRESDVIWDTVKYAENCGKVIYFQHP